MFSAIRKLASASQLTPAWANASPFAPARRPATGRETLHLGEWTGYTNRCRPCRICTVSDAPHQRRVGSSQNAIEEKIHEVHDHLERTSAGLAHGVQIGRAHV